jgi:hypothetical protein
MEESTSTLAAQSANIEATIAPPAAQQATPTEPDREQNRDLVMEEFGTIEGKPDASQIEQWKQQHEEVSLVGLSAEEMYIFRPIRRIEWKALRSAASDEENFKEAVVGKAVLWPKIGLGWFASSRAGTTDTLYELILLNSNFLSPDMAVALVRKL